MRVPELCSLNAEMKLRSSCFSITPGDFIQQFLRRVILVFSRLIFKQMVFMKDFFSIIIDKHMFQKVVASSVISALKP